MESLMGLGSRVSVWPASVGVQGSGLLAVPISG